MAADDKVVIGQTHGSDDPEAVLIGYLLGVEALRAGKQVVMWLTKDGVHVATDGHLVFTTPRVSRSRRRLPGVAPGTEPLVGSDAVVFVKVDLGIGRIAPLAHGGESDQQLGRFDFLASRAP